ncbi:MAG: Hsp20/alpha crystallin family protein [bacterium]|nr:Hsp20/alpha crystallin family protein [bacterium]
MFSSLEQMINQLLSAQQKQLVSQPTGWQELNPQKWPAFNLFEEAEQFVLTAELPGFAKADLELEVKQDQFTLRAKLPQPAEPKAPQYVHRERGLSGFERSLKLPYLIDAEQVSAHFEEGVLTVFLPQHESDKARQIALA